MYASGVSCAYVAFCFFFFQAEDGIRDVAVTGVQTCALPILTGPGGYARMAVFNYVYPHIDDKTITAYYAVKGPGGSWDEIRSEERRVGKEGRTRWAPDHLKKKKKKKEWRINRTTTKNV